MLKLLRGPIFHNSPPPPLPGCHAPSIPWMGAPSVHWQWHSEPSSLTSGNPQKLPWHLPLSLSSYHERLTFFCVCSSMKWASLFRQTVTFVTWINFVLGRTVKTWHLNMTKATVCYTNWYVSRLSKCRKKSKVQDSTLVAFTTVSTPIPRSPDNLSCAGWSSYLVWNMVSNQT